MWQIYLLSHIHIVIYMSWCFHRRVIIMLHYAVLPDVLSFSVSINIPYNSTQQGKSYNNTYFTDATFLTYLWMTTLFSYHVTVNMCFSAIQSSSGSYCFSMRAVFWFQFDKHIWLCRKSGQIWVNSICNLSSKPVVCCSWWTDPSRTDRGWASH